MTATMFNFFVNTLFGNVWMAVFGLTVFFAFIGVIGKMGAIVLGTLLLFFLVTMGILFGGVVIWILAFTAAVFYFVMQLLKYSDQ